MGNGDCRLHHICVAPSPTLFSPAPAWGPSHRIQPLMSYSNMSPSHGLQFFKKGSITGPFHGAQSFRNRLLQHRSPMGYSSCQETWSCTGFPLIQCLKHLVPLLPHWPWCLWDVSLLFADLCLSQLLQSFFYPYSKMFSQRYHQLHWWAQLWPAVGPIWSQVELLSCKIVSLVIEAIPAALPATKTLPHNSDTTSF